MSIRILILKFNDKKPYQRILPSLQICSFLQIQSTTLRTGFLTTGLASSFLTLAGMIVSPKSETPSVLLFDYFRSINVRLWQVIFAKQRFGFMKCVFAIQRSIMYINIVSYIVNTFLGNKIRRNSSNHSHHPLLARFSLLRLCPPLRFLHNTYSGQTHEKAE